MSKVNTKDFVEKTGVKFGTSGLRDLVSNLTDKVCYVYVTAFLQFLKKNGYEFDKVAIAGDLRESTDRIMQSIAHVVNLNGYKIINCGKIPTPAVTYYAIQNKIPSIMTTGSHIPTDRNGIKFQKPDGEILKEDEIELTEQTIEMDDSLFKGDKFIAPLKVLMKVENSALEIYRQRYLSFFPRDFLKGKHIGLYGHSAVGRDLNYDLLTEFGAEVTKLAFAKPGKFIPIDTDAFRKEDLELIHNWGKDGRYDTIISTDGDGDRPMISTESGEIINGDSAAVIASHFLRAEAIATTISSNTQVDKSGYFKKVTKTKIGSPRVIRGVTGLVQEGFQNVIGFELNGGFITLQDIKLDGKTLKALPTRDALTLILLMLYISVIQNKTISELMHELPPRYTSNRKALEFPTQKSLDILELISTEDEDINMKRIEKLFKKACGNVKSIDRLDGIRIEFENEEIVHLRPSKNAPEFRAYTEATTVKRAKELNDICMNLYEKWRSMKLKEIFPE